MTGSAQHQLAQWLTSVIDPVLSLYSTYCISDSFTFADKVKTFNFPPSVFLCSYDVCSLFTNVPLAETIEICANALYDGDLTPPPFPRAVFVELMQTATSSVEFSFNNIMHRQIDEYNDNKFSILARGRTSFHLSALEATYIKTSKPNLCKQKEFVYGLKITH